MRRLYETFINNYVSDDDEYVTEQVEQKFMSKFPTGNVDINGFLLFAVA